MTLREAFLKQSMQELHVAAQLVAAIGHTYLPPHERHHHMALLWDARGWLKSQVARPGKSFEVALDIEHLQLHFLGHADAPQGEPSATLTLRGKTLKQAYTWLDEQLARYLNREFEHVSRLEELPYTLPSYPIQRGSMFTFHDAALKTCKEALSNGYAQIAYLHKQYASNAHPILIWPKHLILSALFTEADREIDAGFSFPTAKVSQPHYFLRSTQTPDAKPERPHGQWVGEKLVSTAETPQEITAFLTENMHYLWTLPHQSKDFF